MQGGGPVPKPHCSGHPQAGQPAPWQPRALGPGHAMKHEDEPVTVLSLFSSRTVSSVKEGGGPRPPGLESGALARSPVPAANGCQLGGRSGRTCTLCWGGLSNNMACLYSFLLLPPNVHLIKNRRVQLGHVWTEECEYVSSVCSLQTRHMPPSEKETGDAHSPPSCTRRAPETGTFPKAVGSSYLISGARTHTQKQTHRMNKMQRPEVSDTHVIKSVFIDLPENGNDVSGAERELCLRGQNVRLATPSVQSSWFSLKRSSRLL